MNSYLAKTAQAWILITRPRLVSPRPGLRTIANTENIINNTNNTPRLQPADSTETGADHSVHQSGGTPVFLTREPR